MGNANTSCCKNSDPNSVGGVSMIYMPFFIRSRIIESMNIAELICAAPPDTAQIMVVT